MELSFEGKVCPLSKPKCSSKAKDNSISSTLETISMLVLAVCGKTLGKCRKSELIEFGKQMLNNAEGHYYKGFLCLAVAADMTSTRKLVESEFAGRAGLQRLDVLSTEARARAEEFTAHAMKGESLAIAGS